MDIFDETVYSIQINILLTSSCSTSADSCRWCVIRVELLIVWKVGECGAKIAAFISMKLILK